VLMALLLLVNAGGGVDVWLRRGSGLRFEIRDHAGLTDHWRGRHLLDFRVGYVWRRQIPLGVNRGLALCAGGFILIGF
jgi:hypothetical protein